MKAMVLAAGVRFIGPNVIGEAVRIGDRACLTESNLLPGAYICASKRVQDFIIGDGYALRVPSANQEAKQP